MRAPAHLLLALLAGCGSSSREPDPRLDGLWEATSIDGKPVPADRFLLRLRNGRVVGGRDGCNSWGYDETVPPAPDGSRTIVSDLMGCPAIPQRPAYWRALGNGNVVPALRRPDSQLRIAAGGAEILARRAPEKRPPGPS